MNEKSRNRNFSRRKFIGTLATSTASLSLLNELQDITVAESAPVSSLGDLLRVTPLSITAREATIVQLEFTAPAQGIAVNGNIHFPFYLKPFNGMQNGLSEDKKSNSMVSVTRSDGGAVEAVNIITNPDWDILSDMKVYVRETPLSAGEKITITYGTGENKVRAGRKQRILVLEVALDASGNGQYVRLPGFQLKVKAMQPQNLYLVAQSNAVVGEPVRVIAYAQDRSGNVCEDYINELLVTSNVNGNIITQRYKMNAWDESKDLNRNSFSITFSDPGIYYIEAVDTELNINAISNPVKVMTEKPEKELLWGEIHVHSQLSDGRGELADVYRDGYARGLDFISVTDHRFGRGDRGTMRERLKDICINVERYNRDDDYITIPAGETHYLPQTHMNLYFLEPDAGLMEKLVNRLEDLHINQGWENLSSAELTSAGKRYWEAFNLPEFQKYPLAFSHHTMWIGINQFINDDRQRLIEIHSTHGCSETRDPEEVPSDLRLRRSRLEGDPSQKYSVREVLSDGHRLGFVGGSDNHDGQPGVNAITAVRLSELSRKEILEALYNRECYATSSNRSIIEFTVNDIGMGKSVKAGKNMKFHCLVAGDGIIDSIEIIGNGKVVYTHDQNNVHVAEFDWTFPDTAPGYYYIRTFLNNGEEGAWSTPVWIE